MNVQLKITLLLLALAGAFVAAAAAIKTHEDRQLGRLTAERTRESETSFDRRLARESGSLTELAHDFSAWDDLALAAARGDSAWLREHVGEADLTRSDANAIWVFDEAGRRLHAVDNLDTHAPLELPLPPAAFEKLRRDRFGHFYVAVPHEGWMEIRAAAVATGSGDADQRAPPGGFFFAGRLWNAANLAEWALLSSNDRAFLLPAALNPPAANRQDVRDGTVLFTRELPGWDDQPAARLVVRSVQPVIGQLRGSSRQLFWAMLLFAAAMIGLLSFLLVRWVGRPLHLISECLWRQDLAPIAPLELSRNEFGGLARLIRHFFEQRDSLVEEIHAREATQAVLVKREEELRHAQKLEAVGRLAGGVAHDFNNLLTAILGYSELLVSRLDQDPVGRQNAELILQAGRQAAAVTYQLLAFSRKQLLQPRVINLNLVVGDMERLLRRVIGEHIELDIRPEAELARVRADPHQLEQVILNLGVNARDAMPRGGRLRIATSDAVLADDDTRPEATELPSGEYVVLHVSDTGVGMSQETITRIFEPFFTTKGPGQGTGLGLATVYGIVKQSGGGVTVESRPNKGSTFRVYLPVEHAPVDEPVPVPPPPARPTVEEAETVLVVEDEEMVRELVCTVLSEQGYRVLHAPDGRAALALAGGGAGEKSPSFDLLITDVVMPGMSGPDLVAQLTERRPGLRVLFVSGYSENDISDQGIIHPGIQFLEKPFTPNALARKVREVLDEPLPPATVPIPAQPPLPQPGAETLAVPPGEPARR